MRHTPNVRAERYRIRTGQLQSFTADGNNGAFFVPVGRAVLLVLVSDQLGWDHVSVSLPDRCPTWDEMCAIKQMFFHDNEWAIQYLPAKSANISDHPYCLHLWRPQEQDIPKPPAAMVGRGVGPERAAILGPTGMQLLADQQLRDQLAGGGGS